MESFVNRQATNINRKRLNVVDVEHDSSGNVTSLVVDEVRADSDTCTETGTRLDKESIESAILNLIYTRVYALNFSTGVDNLLNVNGNRIITISHNSSKALYPKYVNDGGAKYDMIVSRNSSSNAITVSFDFNPNYTSAYEEIKILELYLDSAFTNLYCTFLINITYTPSSTGSGD